MLEDFHFGMVKTVDNNRLIYPGTPRYSEGDGHNIKFFSVSLDEDEEDVVGVMYDLRMN